MLIRLVNILKLKKHIDKLTDILIGENDDLNIANEYDTESIYEMEQEIDDKSNAIDSASSTLSDMKKVVEAIQNKITRTTLLAFIESMEIDLC